ncbi:hypothetical protein NDU88_001209 [Pleurodeles waltl]|uniref:Uncharacterized protein n=1 Tax=Pleurodeles waltl TaxID=8319 RepID=A0AAV7KQV3_PLEWA|nr:hypothetical protein NDU88_001209 [Pleurodeles waltl]
MIPTRLLDTYTSFMEDEKSPQSRNGEQDGGRVTQLRSVCSDQGNLPVLRQLSRGSEPPSAAALTGNNVAAL